MSSFLGQIIARGMNQTPVVRPRLPSIFEPIHGTAASSWIETLAPNPASDPVREQRGVVPVPQAAHPNVPEPVHPTLTRPESGTTGNASAQEIAPPIQTTRLSAQFPTEREQTPIKLRSAERIVPDRPASPVSKVLPGNSTPFGNEAPYVGPLTHPTSSSQSGHHPDSAASNPTGRIGPRPPHHRAIDAVRSTQSAQRTINVTIGRVEVRAMLPQQKSVKARWSPPAHRSLEEYLKQRNGGRS